MAQPKLSSVTVFPSKKMDNQGGGGDNDDMDQRIKALESTIVEVRDRLARVETRLDHTSTKEDVVKVESSLIKWFVGTALALSGLAFAAARWIS